MSSLLKHPHRALPPGMQWVSHCGEQARHRYLRQQARQELKRLRKEKGSRYISGVDASGGLLLDFPEPVRAK